MAKTISELRNQSIQVRDASAAGENTATRVGTVLNDIVGHIEDYENTQSSNNSSQDAKIEGVKSSLDAEISRAKTEESNLRTQIANETKERQAAVSSEETARIQADNAEKTARQQADNAEQDARIQADNDEKTARENADITLRTMIQTEVSNRQIAVKQEEIRAMAAEKANTQAIEDENARAKTAEQANAQAIADETTRATAEEERLQGEIDNTNTNVGTLENKVNSNHDHLTDEVARLDTTDIEIKADLEAEKARAQEAELANTTAIEAEAARATAAEEAIIFDVSEHNDGAVFESLQALLSDSNLGTLIPVSFRHGGMTIRYVQTSDNKYIQARLMAQNFTTDVAQWQVVDDKPVAGSENLVKSGGVAKKIMPKFVSAYNSKRVWVIDENHRSFYIFCHKGDVITIAPNAERGTEYINFLSSIDTSVAPVFANGTDKAIIILETTDFVLKEDCYVLWIDFLNLSGGEIWTPSILELNHVSLFTEPYDQLISSLNSLALINDANKIIDERTSLQLEINKVDRYYFDNNGTWIAGESHSCLYLQLKSGDIFSATGGADYGSRIAFITSVPNTSETLVFADGTTRAINILANNKYTREVNVDCYVIWIKYLAFGPGQVWSPSKILINLVDILEPNILKNVQEIAKPLINLQEQVSNVESQISELKTSYVKNLATYYQKGGSPKTFESNKKICIITAGQSNTDGRVPYADMPESIKNAQPIVDCQIVRNSETATFSSLNITGDWAFDLITYYNLVTRNDLSIYAIKWAVGGTSIDPLGDSQSHWTADYEELPSLSNSLLLKFESEIRNHIASNGEDFAIRAMLWHQGEGDRGSLGTGSADRYYTNLSNMIAYIRGIVGNERLPFITGTISHNSAQYDAKIEAAQYQIASEDPYYYLIDMSGATLLDSYHFDAVSTEYFGEMAYDKLIDAGVISGTKINPIAPW